MQQQITPTEPFPSLPLSERERAHPSTHQLVERVRPRQGPGIDYVHGIFEPVENGCASRGCERQYEDVGEEERECAPHRDEGAPTERSTGCRDVGRGQEWFFAIQLARCEQALVTVTLDQSCVLEPKSVHDLMHHVT